MFAILNWNYPHLPRNFMIFQHKKSQDQACVKFLKFHLPCTEMCFCGVPYQSPTQNLLQLYEPVTSDFLGALSVLFNKTLNREYYGSYNFFL